ncbi:hypothetical protein ACFLSJ_06015, partial [Verrucomicrobiota bacterium]
VYTGGILTSGGKHYGHLEVNVSKKSDGDWEARITPVHSFPLIDRFATVTGFERRVYDDEVVLTAEGAPPVTPTKAGVLSVH